MINVLRSLLFADGRHPTRDVPEAGQDLERGEDSAEGPCGLDLRGVPPHWPREAGPGEGGAH